MKDASKGESLPQSIVKQCACMRTYTRAQWEALPFVGIQESEDDNGKPERVELRNCPCASTIAIILPDTNSTNE